ncbi:7263_t:CDS:2, partial [Racocetra persica]
IVAKQISLEAQLSKNEPELKRFTDRLAFTMEGVRDDAILFTFTCIYENDPSQPCSFTLDVGETIYTVLECNPPLDQIEELVTLLNESRDFYTFVKRMRQAF